VPLNLCRKQQQQRVPLGYEDMSTSDSDSDSGPLRVPLKLVVADAVKRWFNETLSEVRCGRVWVCFWGRTGSARTDGSTGSTTNASRRPVARTLPHVQARRGDVKQQVRRSRGGRPLLLVCCLAASPTHTTTTAHHTPPPPGAARADARGGLWLQAGPGGEQALGGARARTRLPDERRLLRAVMRQLWLMTTQQCDEAGSSCHEGEWRCWMGAGC